MKFITLLAAALLLSSSAFAINAATMKFNVYKFAVSTSAATTSGNCTAGVEFSDVICGDGQLSQLIDGTSVTCSGLATNNQHVTLFLTTISAGASGNNALLPPTTATDSTRALRLTSPFVVSASRAGVLSVNATNFLSSGGGTCNTTAPTFSFQ